MNHRQWLDNQYQQWVAALKECTVDNFKEHPMVRRMLSLDMDGKEHLKYSISISEEEYANMRAIDFLGTKHKFPTHVSGACNRMIYYAQKVLAANPSHICEIGGGVGQFYAVLRALGYKGKYWIYDIPEVKDFQYQYLEEVMKRTNLRLWQDMQGKFDYCVSFYALGEFDDETKQQYIDNVVKQCPHGLVLWNPHSGASDQITWDCKIEDENPLTSPGNKMLTW